jgi:hypothetical protein
MLDLQENIAKAQSATAALRHSLVNETTRAYFSTLDVVSAPTPSDFEGARARAHAVLKQQLLSPDAVAAINGGKRLGDDGLALLALTFDTITRPLRIPAPVVAARARSTTLALAAAGGAALGMLAGAPLLRLAYDMRDLGLAVGGPLGAFLGVLVVHQLARLRLLARILPWLFTRPKALRGPARAEQDRVVRAAVEQWVDWAVPMLTILCLHQSQTPGTETDTEKALRRIGKLVYALHQAPAPSLPVVADELIQEAKNSGFAGLEGPPAFLEAGLAPPEITTWKKEFQNRYETFGDIAEGDQVRIERPAVIFDGRVVQRGLVRKVRDRT